VAGDHVVGYRIHIVGLHFVSGHVVDSCVETL
jgi:hypothetical protein